MAELQLSRRLATLAAWVPVGSRVADIGSDHALLPCVMAQAGQVRFAIAGEVNEGPYQAASNQIRSSGLSNIVQARKGNGLAVIEPEDNVEVITIAGMGGALISQILTEGLPKLANVRRLILQPNVGEDIVRRWLVANDWALLDETILEEDGKFYEVLLAERVESDSTNQELYAPRVNQCGEAIQSEQLYTMGPYLIERGGEVFQAKWQSENDKLRKIMKDLQQSEREEAKQRAMQFLQEIETVEAILRCLLTVTQ
jgi:tRNA (adenine22-N1)-methyltransferase